MSSIKDFNLLDADLQAKTIEILAREFYGDSRLEKGVYKFHQDISQGITIMQCLIADYELAGVSTHNIFPWERQAAQLNIQAKYENNRISKIRLQSFESLIVETGFKRTYSSAIELAYTFIHEKYRGKGFHRKLFEARFHRITEAVADAIIFTLARSDYAGTGITQQTLDYLLSIEKEVNGLSESGKVNVQGVWVNVNDFKTNIGYDISNLTPLSGTPSTVHLAQDYGFIPVGFSKNFSAIFATDINALKKPLSK